ncbi:phosphopantetheine-binding protein, partial [Actinosynnema sp. NPDC059797]
MTATTRPRVARARIQSWLTDRIALLAGVDPAGVDPTAPLDDYGITSSQAVSLSGELEEWLGDELPQTLVYQHPSIAALADFLAGDAAADAPAAPAPPARGPGLDAVCVVGMACRFPPDADDPGRFWR